VSRERLGLAIDALEGLVPEKELKMCRSLLSHVVSKRHPPKAALPASQ